MKLKNIFYILVISYPLATLNLQAGNKRPKLLIPELIQTEALAHLQTGNLTKFDPLCGDTACQLRVPRILNLFNKNKNNEMLTPEDLRFLSLTYLLTESKTKEYSENQPDTYIEKINLKKLGELLNKTKEDTASLEIPLKRETANLALKCFYQLSKKRNEPNLLIKTEKKTPKADIPTIPCFLSMQGLLDILKEKEVPIVLLEVGTNKIFPLTNSKNLTPKSNDIYAIISGTSKDAKLLTTQNEKALKNIILANALDHPQIGSKKDSSSLQKLLLESLPKNIGQSINSTNATLESALAVLSKYNSTKKDNSKETNCSRKKISSADKSKLDFYITILQKAQELTTQGIHTLKEQFSIDHIFLASQHELAQLITPQHELSPIKE